MNYQTKAFTLIELLVVVALIGVIATIGVKGYQSYVKSAQKKVVKQNFINTIKYMEAEIAKCKLNKNGKAFGLPCPVSKNSVHQECAAVYLSWRYNVRNPLVPNAPAGWTASRHCPTLVQGNYRGGVRSGNSQQLGDVNIVICPRSPYCGRNPKSDGHFKVMWWWDSTSRYEDARIVKIY
tara:strand:- start:195 stop:734 length:540 start_codon:yes stop_codon:yes gene_type:complete